ncbi:g2 mitotic-specific cyclin-4 [Trichoderma cornu-damae]|uniref:G2 mitotic-specific cyclin-4 n=1 Tax=Trichoderma cornu-damae TaxID=654480 RepID=A0A9P8QTL9_9HYPO|nr:g2 mitotic-specific cyclin-4 [Trichoderma cornu-damae]
MDARPFRPRGGENVQQLLHQRHKSMGNVISSVPSIPAAGFKGPAKRAAFGDVTNVSKVLGGRGEEAKGAKKAVMVSTNHASASFLNKENAVKASKDSLSRPAQRPIALASNRPKTTTTEARAEAPQKKPTSIATKESAYKIDIDIPQHHGNKSSAVTQKKHPSSLTAPEVHALQPRHHKSQPQLRQQQPTLRRTQSKVEKVDRASNRASLPAVDIQPIVMPALIEDFLTDDDSYLDPLGFPPEEASHSGVNHDDNYAEVLSKLPNISEEPTIDVATYKEGLAASLSEAEDYWDDEDNDDDEDDEDDDDDDDDEYDDQDQAYTTAHSTRSRDMTLGNATTILAPRVTSRVQRELEEARIEVEQTMTPEEIDEEMWDVSMVAEYGDEIFEYLRELEIKMLPNPHYMEMQTEIQWSMRTVLMDWLVQVHHRFNLLPETLFLTVNYIDRFLSCKIVSIGKLQLVGATAILVASKYEEINCPSLDEIVYMVDGGYTTEDILKAERFMLSMLGFELGWPGPMSFLRRVSKADDYDLDTRTLAKYFLELTIMDERFVASPPSFLSAGAHCLSRLILNKGEWSKRHVHYSGYTWSQLKPLVTMMIECCENPLKHHGAVFEKYREKRFKEASVQVQHALDAGFTLPHHSTPVRRLHSTRLPSASELQYGSLLIPIEG